MTKRVMLFLCAVGLAVGGAPSPAIAGDAALELVSANGDAKLGFGIQYRPRYEYNEDKDFTDDSATDFFSHRARLSLSGSYQDYLTAVLEVQDVRAWGAEGDTLGDADADAFDLHQGYVLLKTGAHCSLKIGRQEIAFDAHRIVGTVDWAQQARSFDAIRTDYAADTMGLSLIYAKVTEGDSGNWAGADTDVAMLHGSYKPSDSLYVACLAVWDGQDQVELSRYTVGPYLKFTSGGFHIVAEGYGQFGSLDEADYAAFLGSLCAGYAFDVDWKPAFSIWFDYLSGDDDPLDSDIKVFDTLFATNHKFYGTADYFLNIPVHTGGLGIMDLAGRAKIRPHEKLICQLDAHYFQTAEDTGNQNSDLGVELDLSAKVPWKKGLTFSSGVSLFMAGDAMEDLRNNDDDTELYGYLMADIKI